MPKIKMIILALVFATILPVSAQEFSDVPALHTFAVGYAGAESKVYQSFRAVLDKGEAARPIFRRCLKTGSPAAKLYSAIGLYKLDFEIFSFQPRASPGHAGLHRLDLHGGRGCHRSALPQSPTSLFPSLLTVHLPDPPALPVQISNHSF